MRIIKFGSASIKIKSNIYTQNVGVHIEFNKYSNWFVYPDKDVFKRHPSAIKEQMKQLREFAEESICA